jgi:hypothetical protein
MFIVVSLTTNIVPKANYKFVGPQKGPTLHQHGIQCLHIVLGKTQHVFIHLSTSIVQTIAFPFEPLNFMHNSIMFLGS